MTAGEEGFVQWSNPSSIQNQGKKGMQHWTEIKTCDIEEAY